MGISEKRHLVYSRMVNSCSINPDDVESVYASCDLYRLFFLYDEVFFGESVLSLLNGSRPTLCFVDKSSRVAGTANVLNNSIEINIRCFRNFYAVDREKNINGIVAKNVFYALLLTFEHELSHLITYCHYHESGHGAAYKLFVQETFGHTSCRHNLPQKGELSLKASEAGDYIILPVTEYKVGDTVRFEYKSRFLQGKIINIRKRATVEVQNLLNDLTIKYYVPLEYLIKVI